MTGRQSLIDKLDETIASKGIAARAEVLRAVTELFLSGCTKYSDENVALFDDVMGRLIEELDHSVRAEFVTQLAEIPNAPPNVIRALALDDSIEIAGPILSQSERLDEDILVESAKTKSQDHLLAISRRRTLNQSVTDVLVERGDQKVALSVTANLGAEFSEFGYSKLVERAQNDGELAIGVLARPEIPRQHALNLFRRASEGVRRKLESENPQKTELIRGLIAQASDRIQAKSREASESFSAAQSLVRKLHNTNQLTEAKLVVFARSGQFYETVVAIALMCKVPIGVVERAIINDESDQILVLARAIDLSWDTTKAILLIESETNSVTANNIGHNFKNYNKLSPELAKKALQFYRLREKSDNHSASKQ